MNALSTTTSTNGAEIQPKRALAKRRSKHACRFCEKPVDRVFVDLGLSPLCQSFVTPEQVDHGEMFHPLKALVCDHCRLVQLPAYVGGEDIFSEYAYFSSYSQSWLDHCQAYAERMTSELELGSHSQVVELASNDGYLLQYFVARHVPALGIEPAANVAEVAVARGVPTRVMFFGTAAAEQLADEGVRADLLIGNNVLAHVPDLNDFVAGMQTLLAPSGRITMEFPHLMRLIEQTQFDTIYHEHFSYFSLHTVRQVFAAHGLTIFDVEELPTHGGSIRIHAERAERRPKPTFRLRQLADAEYAAGVDSPEAYQRFQPRVERVRADLLEFLLSCRRDSKTVAGYGAPGKGNTLLNYCGIRTDLLPFTVDRNPYKHGTLTPGARIPVHPVQRLDEMKPDYILILPWNLKDEIMGQMERARNWGARFVAPIPELTVY